GGHVFFSTINRNPKAFAFAIVGAEYLLRMLPRGTHEYAKFIRPAELSRWAREADLDTRDIIGLTYNPLLRHYKLAPDVDVNYMIHCQPGQRPCSTQFFSTWTAHCWIRSRTFSRSSTACASNAACRKRRCT